MIYRAPPPLSPKQLAARQKVRELIRKSRLEGGTDRMEAAEAGDPGLILGNGRREAILRRLAYLKALRHSKDL